MRIQDETDCHLSRLSRSLMTRTAFGRVLTPAVQAPGIDSSLYYFLFFPRSSSSSACPSLSLPPCTVSPLSSCFPLLFPRCSHAFETVEFDLLGLDERDPEPAGNVRLAWDKGKSFCGTIDLVRSGMKNCTKSVVE